MPKITEMFLFIAEDQGPEDEGVAAFFDRLSGVMLPLVGADMARVASLRSVAQMIARETGKQIKLVRFSLRENLEVIEPGGETP